MQNDESRAAVVEPDFCNDCDAETSSSGAAGRAAQAVGVGLGRPGSQKPAAEHLTLPGQPCHRRCGRSARSLWAERSSASRDSQSGGGPRAHAVSNSNAQHVSDLAVDSRGRVFAADISNSRIQVIDAAGEASTFAGTGDGGFSGDGGPATEAHLNRPCNVAVDPSANVCVVERDSYRIRKIDVSGAISTFAGTGTRGDTGNGGPAVEAQLDSLCGALATDALGNVYVAERWSRRIRRIDTLDVITTFATFPDQIERPVVALAADESGNLFLGTEWRVLRIDPKGSFSVIAGTGQDGYGGDARSAGSSVSGLAVNRFGDVWLADIHSRRIRGMRRQ